MGSLSFSFVCMVFAATFCPYISGQDQGSPTATNVNQNLFSNTNTNVSNSRLRLEVIELENRDTQNRNYIWNGKFRMRCIDTAPPTTTPPLQKLELLNYDPFSSAVQPLADSPRGRPLTQDNRQLTYSVTNFGANDGGYYICQGQLPDSGQIIRSDPIALNIVNSNRAIATPNSIVAVRRDSLEHAHNVTLNCTSALKDKLPILWSKQLLNGARETITSVENVNVPLNRAKYALDGDGQALTISNVTNADAGNYTCRLDLRQFEPVRFQPEQNIRLEVAPFVKPFGTTDYRSHVVGDTMALKCEANVNPNDNTIIEWSHDGKPLDIQSDVLRASSTADGGVTAAAVENTNARHHYNITNVMNNGGWLTSTLEFPELHNSDSGRYVCRVRNAAGEYSRQVAVKVKDKFAALYPFLIILAEVIVLVVIIFIYERRHNKKAAQQSDQQLSQQQRDYRTEVVDDDEEAQPVNVGRRS